MGEKLLSTGKEVVDLTHIAICDVADLQSPRLPTKRIIVKILLPIVQKVDAKNPPRAYVYNENHSIRFEAVLTDSLKARFGKTEMIAYFYANVTAEEVEIDDRAPNQDW